MSEISDALVDVSLNKNDNDNSLTRFKKTNNRENEQFLDNKTNSNNNGIENLNKEESSFLSIYSSFGILLIATGTIGIGCVFILFILSYFYSRQTDVIFNIIVTIVSIIIIGLGLKLFSINGKKIPFKPVNLDEKDDSSSEKTDIL